MKRYVIIGAGVRARTMFALPIVTELKDYAQLVGICDVNPHRARWISEECGGIPTFADFDEMIDQCKPDVVIVTTVDRFHHEYIIRALEAGCDAISEKPMTTDAEKCRAIMAAEKRTGKKVSITFNCRYMPYVVRVKELLASGVIGDIQSVQMEWMLDTIHGASYFRRWHGHMKDSGGLLVHKATHHFDMINWWLDDEPEKLYAFGNLKFYGPNRENRGERCQTCSHQKTCEFYLDIHADDFLRDFYVAGEKYDGYIRDQCVFADHIDIYDTMSVNAQYTSGALLSYSLTAYNPQSGWRVSFVGSKGRLEAEDFTSGLHSSDPNNYVRIYNRAEEMTTVQVSKAGGDHGGGDERLRRMLFVGDLPDPLGQQAGSRAGAMSMLIGAGANLSIVEQRPVVIRKLLED